MVLVVLVVRELSNYFNTDRRRGRTRIGVNARSIVLILPNARCFGRNGCRFQYAPLELPPKSSLAALGGTVPFDSQFQTLREIEEEQDMLKSYCPALDCKPYNGVRGSGEKHPRADIAAQTALSPSATAAVHELKLSLRCALKVQRSIPTQCRPGAIWF